MRLVYFQGVPWPVCTASEKNKFMQPHIQSVSRLASFPGLLAPAFVACSTNAGEGLVKLSHVV